MSTRLGNFCSPRSVMGFFLVSATLASLAAKTLDLERIEPVAPTEQIPISDFFRAPLLRDPKLNPSGTHIAALVTSGDDHYQLLAYELSTQKIETVGAQGDKDIAEFLWLGDKRLLFSLSMQKLYGVGLFAADLGVFQSAYPLLQYSGARVVGIPPKDKIHPLIWASYETADNGRDGGVLKINSSVRSGHMVNLLAAGANWSDLMDAKESNERHTMMRYPTPSGGMGGGYFTARDGTLAFCKTYENGIERLNWFDGTNWFKSPLDADGMDILTSSNDPDEVVVLGPRQEGKPRAVQIANAKTGKLSDVILQDKAYDFDGWFYREPASQKIVGAVYDRNGPQVTWFTEEYQTLQKVLDSFFPGLVVRIIGNDEPGRIFLVSTFSDHQPPIYYSVDLEKRKVGLIKKSRPWIDPKRMQTMNIIKFKTRDGRQLDAYLTLPAGATKQNPPPLIVLPHGGPWARDRWGFNGEVQFLVSRGYAVLQPNYRGSTGYDWMFPAEDRWDFHKMHNDVTDATKAVLASGHVDASRVAIMGASFGGYLSISGVVNEPSLYKCAISIAGVFDWGAMIHNSKYDQYQNGAYDFLLRRLGDPKKQKDKFEEISPVRHVDQIRVPVFVSHGTEDPVVDVSESRRLIKELEKHKVPHESYIVRGEGHGMQHVGNEVDLYQRVEAFLTKYLPANAPAQVAATVETPPAKTAVTTAEPR